MLSGPMYITYRDVGDRPGEQSFFGVVCTIYKADALVGYDRVALGVRMRA